jgi:DNA-3-methyladenine glycosylase I
VDAVSPRTARRCAWAANGSAAYLDYHDTEWGVPVHDDRRHFEFLILEGAQAGLSWATILNKRAGYARAFAGFDPERVARFTARDEARLLARGEIVRNRLKIAAAVGNARTLLAIQEEFGSFDGYVWRFVDGAPIQRRVATQRSVPVTTRESDALARDLKQRGMRFVGSTIMYAYMQAVGLVNDHLQRCFRWRECRALAAVR